MSGKTLGKYKGLWQAGAETPAAENLAVSKLETAAVAPIIAPAADPVAVTKLETAAAAPIIENAAVTRQETAAAASIITPAAESAISSKAHENLGRQLIAAQKVSRLQLLSLWTPLGFFTWNTWAHARVFALACYCQVEIPEEALRGLRRPLAWLWYRKSSLALVRMLAIVEEKPKKQIFLRKIRFIPPIFIWIFERQLKRAFAANAASSPKVGAGA